MIEINNINDYYNAIIIWSRLYILLKPWKRHGRQEEILVNVDG
ncbi:hypothetical protein Dtox_4088 [Desulfofarcimen acetoxidans DSM 771]|uniref:Uncharacterized protein n=1 Tax=Desulfofarcimen acetoxidans (strain ATCC 49208 / DSM 771 / KCTC 5769 / VKM B-1644 / 5575) TaxID=485916 RepID=C8VYP0_DESAS|nr:hypothetical protein Dtox_4088 [Desulfofarcimen acetoxidans DSM 771]